MLPKVVPLLRGLATYAPGAAALYRRITHTGGTDSGRYCYAVWLRHLVAGFQNGLCSRHPKNVAELGPGDSLGIGLAALLSGAERYYGLDLLPLANPTRNLGVFDELVALFRARSPIPDEKEFPEVHPRLDSYDYPAELIAFREDRIHSIRQSILQPSAPDSLIRYVAPWWKSELIEPGVVDLIVSQAVLEHIDDLDDAYASMRLWLGPAGWMSHQIDFRCHATAHEWNGHWAYPDWLWRLIRGRRAYFINRCCYSDHLALLESHGFRVVVAQRLRGSAMERARLSRSFQRLSDDDLTVAGALVQSLPA